LDDLAKVCKWAEAADRAEVGTARKTNGFLTVRQCQSGEPENRQKTRYENQCHFAVFQRSFLAGGVSASCAAWRTSRVRRTEYDLRLYERAPADLNRAGFSGGSYL
jgi:hypothetical protein